MANYTPTPAQYSRMNAEPYFDDQKFDSMEQFETWKAKGTCYPGMTVSIKEGDRYASYVVQDDLSLSKSSGGGAETESEIEVNLGSGGSVGGLKTGDTIPAGTSFEQFIKKLTQVKVTTQMTQPSLSLSISPSGNNRECGEKVTVACTPRFNKGGKGSGGSVDGTYGAGAVTDFIIKRGSETIKQGTTVESFTDTEQTVPDGNISYSASVTYGDGQVPTDNLGQPDPSAQIQGGTKTANASVGGQRKCFWGDSASELPYATSENIRALANGRLGGLPSQITTGASSYVVIAYPASKGEIRSIIQVNASNADITGQFSKDTVQVEGANGYQAVDYYVYHMAAAAPFANGTPLAINF